MPAPKTTGGKTYDRWFENSIMTGFVLSLVTIFATALWWQPGQLNAFWPAAAMALSLSALIPVLSNWLGKKGLPRLFKCLAASLTFSSMVVGMFGFMFGIVVLEKFQSVEDVRTFADREYFLLDPTAFGFVSSKEIDLIVKRQAEVRRGLDAVKRIEKDIEALPVSAIARDLSKAGLAAPRAQLEVEKLSEDSVRRLQAAYGASFEVGKPASGSLSAGTARGEYMTSRSEFKQLRSVLEDRYPLWTKLLKGLGQI